MFFTPSIIISISGQNVFCELIFHLFLIHLLALPLVATLFLHFSSQFPAKIFICPKSGGIFCCLNKEFAHPGCLDGESFLPCIYFVKRWKTSEAATVHVVRVK